MFKIVIDFIFEDQEDMDIVLSAEEVDIKVLDDVSGGGYPVISVIGTQENLLNWLKSNYATDDDEMIFLATQIEEI